MQGSVVKISIYLLRGNNLINIGVSGFTADLKFNASLLNPIMNTAMGELSQDLKERTIKLQYGIIPKYDNVMDDLFFKASLGDAITTTLRLDNIKTMGTDVLIDNIPGLFTLSGICTEGGARLIGSNGKVELMEVRPNPVCDNADIEYETTESGLTQLYLVNSLGEVTLKLIDGVVPKGRKLIQLNTDVISAGSYFLILSTTTQLRSVRLDIVK